jgi:fatty-acyl-CoA synthase
VMHDAAGLDAVQRARRQTISDLLRRTAARVPQKLALVYRDERVRYADLEERVAAVAAALWSAGIARGDRVAVLSKNNLEYVIAYYATLRVGAIWVPLNYMLTPPEAAYILGHVEASALLATPGLRATAEAALGLLAEQGRPLELKVRWLLDAADSVPKGWRALREVYSDEVYLAAGAGADYPVDGGDVAQILYFCTQQSSAVSGV